MAENGRRGRWWVAVLAILLVLVVAFVLVARSRREERSASTQSATTSAPSQGTAGGGGGAEDDGDDGDAPEAPAEEPDGNGDELMVPTDVTAEVECAVVHPVDRPPCSVSLRWTDNADDETGYRVEVESDISGSIRQDMAQDSTLYNRLFEEDDSICLRVLVVRDGETAASEDECVTT